MDARCGEVPRSAVKAAFYPIDRSAREPRIINDWTPRPDFPQRSIFYWGKYWGKVRGANSKNIIISISYDRSVAETKGFEPSRAF